MCARFLLFYQRQFESPLVVSLFSYSIIFVYGKSRSSLVSFFSHCAYLYTHRHILLLFFFFLFFRPSDGRRPDGGKIEEKKQVYNILARSRQRPLSFTSLPPAAFVSLVGRSFFLAFEVITFQLKLLFSFFVLLLLLLYVYTS